EAERGAAAPGAQRANLPAPPSEGRGSVAAAETAAPEVRILAAERTTLADIPFVSFSCQATNPNKAPLTFVGYRPDSFGPPLQEGQIAPIYVVELKRDGEWHEHPMGWCGTGMDAIELPPGGSGSFGFAVPAGPQWEAARVGIRWSPPLTVPFEEVPLAGEEPFTTAWSEPFNPSASE
ncbi:MAG: hypothetical protein WD278_12530, partial [Pirellulales bacterium]